jgi:hypothetical protein
VPAVPESVTSVRVKLVAEVGFGFARERSVVALSKDATHTGVELNTLEAIVTVHFPPDIFPILETQLPD